MSIIFLFILLIALYITPFVVFTILVLGMVLYLSLILLGFLDSYLTKTVHQSEKEP